MCLNVLLANSSGIEHVFIDNKATYNTHSVWVNNTNTHLIGFESTIIGPFL